MSKPLPAAALAQGDLGVWEVCRSKRPASPKGTPRPASRTTSLAFQQAKELINALAFAEALLPADTPWAHATIVLDQSDEATASPRAYLALQGRILARVREWLLCRELPAHFLWVREIGPHYGRAHSHIILPLPPDLRDDLAEIIRRAGRLHDTSNNRAVVVNTNPRNGNRGITTTAARAGVMRDFCKTLSPRARLNGIPIMQALGIDNRKQPPCTIHGKRSGTSESLGRAARAAAGWRERETLVELRAVLPTGEEARKQRNREAQRRRRALKKAGIAPVPSPTRADARRPHELDPFGTDDLAADFFEEV